MEGCAVAGADGLRDGAALEDEFRAAETQGVDERDGRLKAGRVRRVETAPRVLRVVENRPAAGKVGPVVARAREGALQGQRAGAMFLERAGRARELRGRGENRIACPDEIEMSGLGVDGSCERERHVADERHHGITCAHDEIARDCQVIRTVEAKGVGVVVVDGVAVAESVGQSLAGREDLEEHADAVI